MSNRRLHMGRDRGPVSTRWTDHLMTRRELAFVADRERRRPGRRRSERGYVAVTTAILMILFVAIAALGIDTAIWFTRANQLQRAADAAALAGVTKMPRFTDAKALAIQTATNNRFDASQVTVEMIPNSPRQLRVKVAASVPSFFGTFLHSGTNLVREATAEYVPKIELGSKLNAIGTGNNSVYGAQGFWLSINGFCAPKENGDRFASYFEGNLTGTPRCDDLTAPATRNNEYPGDAAAEYTYVVNLPCPDASNPCTAMTPTDYAVDIFDPWFDRTNESVDVNPFDYSLYPTEYVNAAATLTANLRDDDGNILGTAGYGSCGEAAVACADVANATWHPMFVIPAGRPAGRYRIEMRSSPREAYSYGTNSFGLAVHAAGLPGPCAGPTCPTISGETSMSVYANTTGTADFYLAKLSPARYYRGKKIRVRLWDPGEGAQTIQILAPTNAAAPGDYVPTAFTYGGGDPGIASHPNSDNNWTSAGTVTALDVSGLASTLPDALTPAAPWPASDRINDSRYNGRMVEMKLQIPTDYGCASPIPPCVEVNPPLDGWYKIRYISSFPFDVTTWSVDIVGDPVHLVHE